MYKHATKKRRHQHNDYDLYADLEKIKEAFGDAARDVRGKAGEAIAQSFENARERTANLQEGLVNYTKEKPYATIGVAMLAGMAIGFLIRRK